MGRGSKKSKYVHGSKKMFKSADKEHKRQMRTHESEERKMEMVKQMKVNQLKGHVDMQLKRMRSYIPDEIRERMKKPIDPAYNLKGAARVAREYYKPPGDTSVPGDEEARNLLDEFAGRIRDAPNREGEVLIEKMILYAASLHNVIDHTNHAIKVFYEILEYDPRDHFNVKQRILRCYMDMGDAAKARALIDKFDTDESCCFMYTKALIEYISFHLLKEEGSSVELCDNALEAAYKTNPYALYTMAYHSVFSDAIEHASLIQSAPAGSIEDAISFFDSDLELWLDVEGAIDWLRDWMTRNEVPPPLIEQDAVTSQAPKESTPSGGDNGSSEVAEVSEMVEKEKEESESICSTYSEENFHSALGDPNENPLYNEAIAALNEIERHSMYVGMFQTALEMAEII